MIKHDLNEIQLRLTQSAMLIRRAQPMLFKPKVC